MFCKQCGSENADGAMFCCQCGEALGTNAVEEQPAAQMGAENFVAPARNDNAFDLNVEGKEPAQKERRRIPMAAILIAAGVLILAAVVVLLMLPAGKGFVARTFQSPEKLMYTVYSDAVEDVIDKAGTMSAGSDNKALSAEADAHLILGDQVISLLAGMLYSQPEDFEALSDIGLSCTIDSQDDLKKLSYALSLSEKDILTAEQYVNMEDQQMYIVLPELQDQALMIGMGEELSADDMSKLEALAQPGADRELLKTLLLRYMEQYFNAFLNVEKSSKTLQLQGVSQKLTVLETSISEKAQYQAFMGILEALKTDEDAKRFVEGYASVLGEDCYQEFLKSVDSAISDTQYEIDNLSVNNEYLIQTYLNGRNDIVGFTLTYQEAEKQTEAISYISLRDGRQLAHKFVFSDNLVLEGSGTYDKGITGSYMVWYQNAEILEIKLEGLDKKYGGLTGKIRLVPSENSIGEFLKTLGLDNAAVMVSSFLDFSLDITLDSHETGNSADISLMMGSSLLVGLNTSIENHQSEEITLPENYISINDEENVELWVQGIQTDGLDNILDNLEEAGLSKGLMSVLFLLLEQMEV